MNSGKSKILVVDDDARMVDVLRLMLDGAGYTVLSAYSGKEGLRLAYAAHPDLVLLDIMMPGMDGFQVLDALRLATDIPVILLTSASQDPNRIRGLDKGAADFLSKSTAPDVMLAHIRSRLQPATKWKAQGMRHLGETLKVDFSKRSLRVYDQKVHLTPIEWRVFQYLVEHEGTMVAYEELLAIGWDTPRPPELPALKVQISKLRDKLCDTVHPSRFIHTIREEGYLFEVRSELESARPVR